MDVDNALYQLIMEEYMAHYKEPNWVAATYFQYHPNGDISQLAVNMLADKYQLSRMYAKQMVSENVVKEVDMPSDVDMLPDMVLVLIAGILLMKTPAKKLLLGQDLR